MIFGEDNLPLCQTKLQLTRIERLSGVWEVYLGTVTLDGPVELYFPLGHHSQITSAYSRVLRAEKLYRTLDAGGSRPLLSPTRNQE